MLSKTTCLHCGKHLITLHLKRTAWMAPTAEYQDRNCIPRQTEHNGLTYWFHEPNWNQNIIWQHKENTPIASTATKSYTTTAAQWQEPGAGKHYKTTSSAAQKESAQKPSTATNHHTCKMLSNTEECMWCKTPIHEDIHKTGWLSQNNNYGCPSRVEVERKHSSQPKGYSHEPTYKQDTI
jgi:hypothetical protein